MSEQKSRNDRLAELLGEHGDALEQARPVQHWAYFPTEAGRAQFIAFLERRFAEINAHPLAAGSCGGEYDGWETQVLD